MFACYEKSPEAAIEDGEAWLIVVFKAKDSIEATFSAEKSFIFLAIFEAETSFVLISWWEEVIIFLAYEARLVRLVVTEYLISVTIILISSNVSLTVWIAKVSFIILGTSKTITWVSENIKIIKETARLSMRGIIAVSCPVEVISEAWISFMPGPMSVIEAKIWMTSEIILLLTEYSILII